MNTTKSPFAAGLIVGMILASAISTLPFADAEMYRRAKHECEKSLPRDHQCKVVGVPE